MRKFGHCGHMAPLAPAIPTTPPAMTPTEIGDHIQAKIKEAFAEITIHTTRKIEPGEFEADFHVKTTMPAPNGLHTFDVHVKCTGVA